MGEEFKLDVVQARLCAPVSLAHGPPSEPVANQKLSKQSREAK